MTSLTEVYERNAREVSSLRRLYAGTGLVLAGAVLAVLAVLVTTTDLFVTETFAAREYGGILGGLAAPVVLVGVFVVLPASRRIQAAAAISASICLLGVALFWYAYPSHWDGHGRDLTLFVSAVYLVGFFTAIGSLFTAVVNFKTRNDPGGALELTVTRTGETKIVEVEGSSGFGGVGLLGATPDGEVETQTNVPDDESASGTQSASSASATATSAAASSAAAGPSPGTGSPTSDGGSAEADLNSPLDDGRDAEIVDAAADPGERTDRYCGNCEYFEYVRTSSGMTPYCTHDGAAMDDMDACEEWTPNH